MPAPLDLLGLAAYPKASINAAYPTLTAGIVEIDAWLVAQGRTGTKDIANLAARMDLVAASQGNDNNGGGDGPESGGNP